MRAAVRTSYGPPDVVRVAEVTEPQIGDREVLVNVRVATVNRTDCGFRAGKPFIVRFFAGLPRPKMRILGNEFAGVVDAVGPDVTTFGVGDDVFGYSEDLWGAHAEYLVIPEDGPLAPIPNGMSYEEVAPSTEGSHYALPMMRKAKIRAGQRVLVNGGTGAIGSAAVQFLKRLGASVTAVCDAEHMELVRGLGADRVIDYTTEDFTEDGETYDVVLDAVGKSSFGRCRRVLAPHGIYVSTDLGPWNLNPILALVTPLFGGRRVMFPIPPKHDRQSVMELREIMASGDFRPVVDRRYPLERIVEAYRYVESGAKIGNVLITVDPAP
jgi:NADPH:quinone reductase-like Zn-dependent oxidoreductase